jgi:hypothetical protein
VNAGLKLAVNPIKLVPRQTDPVHPRQTYLNAAPEGVGVRAAWAYEGADGKGQRFVDIERGWVLDHKDLVNGAGPRVKLAQINGGVNSREALDLEHGTCVLGIVGATHNNLNAIGIAPRLASMTAMSTINAAGTTGTADAIVAAAVIESQRSVGHEAGRPSGRPSAASGAVILIEVQAVIPDQRYFFPVEIYPDTFDAIKTAIDAGFVVIEPAGNGRVSDEELRGDQFAVDLDALETFLLKPEELLRTLPVKSLHKNSAAAPLTDGRQMLAPFEDSGAIMVGAAERGAGRRRTWTRRNWSNFGSRVDCFAAGSFVVTLNHLGGVSTDFGGTSAASAIVAGAALVVQGVAGTNRDAVLSPAALRRALSDPSCGTRSERPPIDKIGVMPNLAEVLPNHAG